MDQEQDNHYYRVICSSGDTFYTKARSATEYVLDPAFIQFMVLSILLFTSLMQVLGLPAIPQIILFGAGVVSTFFWLTISIAIYVAALKLLGARTIYTPLLLFPMQVTNTFTMDYVLKIFGTSYIHGFDGLWEIALRTFIIVVCLDVFHGKFVAPRHGLTVDVDGDGTVVPLNSASGLSLGHQEATGPAVSKSNGLVATSAPVSPSTDAPPLANRALNGSANHSEPVPTHQPGSNGALRVGRENFDLDSLHYIKSEDHYLVMQQDNNSKMVRGRLREVVAKIDARWGAQINRSAWISYAAVSEIHETTKGHVYVVLSDGSTMRVANSRKMYFEHGCAQYLPDVVWQRGSDGEF